jgi:hypothetical protein
MKVFFWIFSAINSVYSSSMHVSCIAKSHNSSPIILILFGVLQIIKLPIILFQPVLLSLPLFTSRCSHFITFYQTYSISLGLSICCTNITLVQKTVTYHLNTYYRRTLGLDKERSLIIFDKVVFGWALLVAVVQFSPGQM